ncbi:MAG: dual specificity protein phosphatase family protein [Parachlamydiales bacterium]
MNRIEKPEITLPFLFVGVVSAACLLPAIRRFREAHVPFLSLQRGVAPLHLSYLGVLGAGGALGLTHWKRIAYEGSLLYTDYSIAAQGNRWYDEIKGSNIILSAIPLNDRGHLEELKEKGVVAVLACVEDFELLPGWQHTPVTAEQWREAGIEWKQIHAQDYLPMAQNQVNEAMTFLEEWTPKGKVVVHCKAGRGRSATVVTAYQMKKNKQDRTTALKDVQKYRTQVNLNALQKTALTKFEKSLSTEG